jgi:hypothetical protein
MPAEGKLAHDYVLFSREPTWWSARLGQGVHESLATLLLARADPSLAAETQRNFIDRIDPSSFLPYFVGPVVSAVGGEVVAPPLFPCEAWEIAQRANDPAFLANADAPALLGHLPDPAQFLRHDGVASLSATDPAYTPLVPGCCAWSGPAYPPWEYLVVRGLLDAGEADEHARGARRLASEIASRAAAGVRAELTRTHQLRHAYDPDDVDAANTGLPNHMWSSMAALMLLDAGQP